MKNYLTYFAAFAILLAVVMGNHVGQVHDVALKIPYYDVYLHFWGGFGIALLLLGVLQSHLFHFAHSRRGFWWLLLGVFIVGLIWEGYEWYFDVAGAPIGTLPYYLDTLKDLVNDTLGGALALFLAKR